MIPLGKIRDFSSYVTKIKSSGAQALLTGNWGPDLILLIKAGMDSGLAVDYNTMLGHLAGTPTAIGPGGDGRVHSVISFHENIGAETGNEQDQRLGRIVPSKPTTSTSFSATATSPLN